MFNEDEDWNDEQDAQILKKTGLEKTQKANGSTNGKSRIVGKKSLLRTLQTLGSVPEWKSSNHQQDSDSETEAAPSHKKKKRRKKRKRAGRSEEQQENGDLDHPVKEDNPVPKKKTKGSKSGAPNSNNTPAEEKNDKEISKSAEVNVNKLQSTEKMNRQQWKNKMKNKRKCKNKYRERKPEEDMNKAKTDKQGPKEEVKLHPQSNDNSENISQKTMQKKKKERRHKPPKSKNTEEDPPVSEEPQQRAEKPTKSVKADKRASESSADGPKQKADGLQMEIVNEQREFLTKRQKSELSKEESLKRQKLQKMLLRQEESPAEQEDEPAAPEEVKQSRSDSLRSRMEQRLESARFRYINEVLYSTSSGEAKRMFQQDPQAFQVYHKGYTAQVQRWPTNPVDAIISYIRKKSSSLVVADFGCGDCKIARSVKNKVHSFDLAATCELVTVCDMSNVPLGDSSVDIAVFCLSLMGTNLADFLTEASRVLRMGGVLKVAEVASRFDNERNFTSALASLGFKMVSKDTENTHFYSFEFVKTGNAPKNVKKYGLQLKPCVYKKR
ncbi:uncharacterized protein rrp8 isoform 1-T2 [Odontesthes bonariensis]|uniref:uncharacterized protein rrp8 n=1 Tax=Odontesthes bonariensis TaxID=219752 RepID=UPI003F581C5E